MKTDGNQKCVTFKLWHLFALVALSACLSSLCQFSMNFAILASIAVYPALVTLVGIPRLRGYFANGSILSRGSLLAVLSFAWLSFYVLSIGPVVALIEYLNYSGNTSVVSFIDSFYGPANWLHAETILKKPLEWYAELWGI